MEAFSTIVLFVIHGIGKWPIIVGVNVRKIIEPRREKTGLRGFRPGPTQTGLYSLRSRLEA